MKTLFKYCLILFFPVCANGQIATFQSAVNKPFSNFYSDSIASCDSDTTQHFSVGPRLFGISSVSKNNHESSYLVGVSLSANIRNKLTFISHFDYLSENHNSLLIFPGFGREKKRLQYNLKYNFNKFITADLGKGKHFIGDGGTYRGVDQGDTRLDLETLLKVHGQGYYRALDAGVLSVMASFNSWNGDKIHGNRELLTDVLRGELGFDGFVVSDWNGIGQVSGCTPDSCAQAINAGIDMVMVPEDWRTLYDNMLAQAHSGEITEARVDEVTKKFSSGRAA